MLIAALTASFSTGLQDNPKVPDTVANQAQVELSAGVPFVSDADLKKALDDAGVDQTTADAIVDENAKARIAGLRSSLALLAIIALAALILEGRIPTAPAAPAPESERGGRRGRGRDGTHPSVT